MFTYLEMKKFLLKEKLNNFFEDERGAADIVAVILIIVIAVAIAWVFKDRIMELINNLFNQIGDTSGLGSH
ncbi:Flp1 family type IVb pilin [Thomasclavelia saccharogumia]|uniref:Flp1 family type IVb pilin n=1 Tax=Thomasclavelia saccharogumia TaxID=341225 RepID=UPI0005557787|nr:Flp1 family type IVb pilin [Thomasclavelia saccharogumia]